MTRSGDGRPCSPARKSGRTPHPTVADAWLPIGKHLSTQTILEQVCDSVEFIARRLPRHLNDLDRRPGFLRGDARVNVPDPQNVSVYFGTRDAGAPQGPPVSIAHAIDLAPYTVSGSKTTVATEFERGALDGYGTRQFVVSTLAGAAGGSMSYSQAPVPSAVLDWAWQGDEDLPPTPSVRLVCDPDGFHPSAHSQGRCPV